jgi:PKD repeat protein
MPTMLADTFILNRRTIALATAVFVAPFVHEPQMADGATIELPRREISFATGVKYYPFIFINPPTFLSGTIEIQRRELQHTSVVWVAPFVHRAHILPGDNPIVYRGVLPKQHPSDTANEIVRYEVANRIGFTARPRRGRGPLEVQFINTSSFHKNRWSGVSRATYTWYFGDGFVGTGINPKHLYFMPGLYTVRLVARVGPLHREMTRYRYIRVTDWDETGKGLDVSRTNKCLRFGTNPDTHLGFMEITGEGWPMPEARVGAVLMYDDQEQLHGLVLDAQDGLWYNVTPRNGPAGTGMEKHFKDKVAPDGTGGVDYHPRVHFAPDRGNMEHLFISPGENHFYLRPARPEKAGEEGYDDRGYPEDLQMQAEFYADLNLSVAAAKAEDIAMPKHEVRFDRTIDGNVIETQIEFNQGEVALIGREQMFKAVDRPAGPSEQQTSETAHQAALSDLGVWLSRGTGLTNRATLATLAGEAGATEGPDGESDSALSITGPVGLANAAVANGTLMLWHKAGYTIAGAALQEVGTTGAWVLSHATGALPANLELGAGDVFDVRLADTGPLSVAARQYYYENITLKGGDKVLP